MYQNFPVDTATVSGDNELSVTEFAGREYNHYPLTVQAQPGPELSLRVEYDTDVFDAVGVGVLVGRLERVLVAMAADPGRRLSSVDVLDCGERVRLAQWGQRAVLGVAGPAVLSVPQVFGDWVAACPGAVAVTDGRRSVSYRELDEASNRLAHALIGRGVGPGRCVALVVERAVEAVVAVLGVLKTGAAYVPIDAAHPRERIGFVLADAAPVVAVCTAGLGSRVGDVVPVIEVDDPAVGSSR